MGLPLKSELYDPTDSRRNSTNYFLCVDLGKYCDVSHLNIGIQPHFEDLSVIIEYSIYANFRGNTARKKSGQLTEVPENEHFHRSETQ